MLWYLTRPFVEITYNSDTYGFSTPKYTRLDLPINFFNYIFSNMPTINYTDLADNIFMTFLKIQDWWAFTLPKMATWRLQRQRLGYYIFLNRILKQWLNSFKQRYALEPIQFFQSLFFITDSLKSAFICSSNRKKPPPALSYYQRGGRGGGEGAAAPTPPPPFFSQQTFSLNLHLANWAIFDLTWPISLTIFGACKNWSENKEISIQIEV